MTFPPRKKLLRALAGEPLTKPPFWLMRQAGRYLPEYREIRVRSKDFLQLCLSPDLAVEVTLQPLRRFGMDAAILFSDILMVPYGLGQKVAFREGEGPVLDPLDPDDLLAGLSLDRFHDLVAPVYETVTRLPAVLPSETALIGFAGAPWTVATYMVEGGSSRDFARTKQLAFGRPDAFARLMELLVSATTGYLLRQIECGAEAVQLFDSWAGVLPESAFHRWSIAPTRQIVATLKGAYPHIPVIGFPRGAGALIPDYLVGTGVDAVSLDTGVPLAWAKEALRPHGAIQGNLDPLALVVGGDFLASETRRILESWAPGGGFVFNLGHGIVPQTPPEHVAALAALIRAYDS